jgi:hypothetical protein
MEKSDRLSGFIGENEVTRLSGLASILEMVELSLTTLRSSTLDDIWEVPSSPGQSFMQRKV